MVMSVVRGFSQHGWQWYLAGCLGTRWIWQWVLWRGLLRLHCPTWRWRGIVENVLAGLGPSLSSLHPPTIIPPSPHPSRGVLCEDITLVSWLHQCNQLESSTVCHWTLQMSRRPDALWEWLSYAEWPTSPKAQTLKRTLWSRVYWLMHTRLTKWNTLMSLGVHLDWYLYWHSSCYQQPYWPVGILVKGSEVR